MTESVAAAHVLVLLDPRVGSSVAVVRGVRAAMPDWRLTVNLWDGIRFRQDHTDTVDCLRPLAASFDGVIGMVPAREEIRVFADAGRPVVNIASSWLNEGAAHVVVDDEAVGREAGLHLRSRGLRRFAFVSFGGGEPREHGKSRRRRGYADAVGDFIELPLSPAGRAADAERLIAWFRAQTGPVGVFAYNDMTGRHVLHLLARAGVAVPLAAAVVAADDDDALCQACLPTLSSVRMPWQALGSLAAERLAAMLAGERATAEPLRLPPLGVAVRGSSDIVANPDPLVRRALRWIHEHVATREGVEDLARAISASRRAIERRFESEVGMSPGALLRRLRLDHVGRRLVASDAPVREIARSAGFRSATAFDRSFQRRMGMTPAAWRRAQRSAE